MAGLRLRWHKAPAVGIALFVGCLAILELVADEASLLSLSGPAIAVGSHQRRLLATAAPPAPANATCVTTVSGSLATNTIWKDVTTSLASNFKNTSTTLSSSSVICLNTKPAAVTPDPPLWQAVLSVVLVVLMFVVLALEYFEPDCVMLATLTIFMCLGPVPIANCIVGFSNNGMLTVLALMAAAAGLESAGAFNYLRYVMEFGFTKTSQPSVYFVLLRMCVFCGGLSAFLNNTPIVAVMIPILQEFARKYGFSPAELMLPMSYAVILGGTVTTIGTSTNLVAIDLMKAKMNAMKPPVYWNMGLFDMGRIGLPVLLAGIVYIVAVGPFLFSHRRVKPWIPERVKTYLIAFMVENAPGNSIIGKKLKDTGLLTIHADLRSIMREVEGAKVAVPIDDELVLALGDVILISAEVESVNEILRFRGLVFAGLQDGEHGVLGAKHWLWHQVYLDNRRLIEASIGGESALIGKRVDDVSFRTEFNAIPVALHRASFERSTSAPLEAGDSILVLSTDEFISKYSRDSTFSLVQLVSSFRQIRHRWAPAIATACAIGFILTGSFVKDANNKDISLLIPVLCSLIVMAVTGCASQTELRSGAKLDLMIMIAVGFGISEALTIMGGAKMVASWVVNAAQGNLIGLVVGVYFVVVLFNAAVTNNAAVSIFFPIAWEIAAQAKIDFMPILYTLMFAGSADFSTPYGYQCNLMVYAPGGYNFSDYLKFGIPLQIICGIFTCVIVLTMDYWWIYTVCLIVLAILVATVFFCLGGHESRPNDDSVHIDVRLAKEISLSDNLNDGTNLKPGVAVPLSELPTAATVTAGLPNFVYYQPSSLPFPAQASSIPPSFHWEHEPLPLPTDDLRRDWN